MPEESVTYEIQYAKRGSVHTLPVPYEKTRKCSYMSLLLTVMIDRYPHRDWWLIANKNHGQEILFHHEDFCAQQDQNKIMAYA